MEIINFWQFFLNIFFFYSECKRDIMKRKSGWFECQHGQVTFKYELKDINRLLLCQYLDTKSLWCELLTYQYMYVLLTIFVQNFVTTNSMLYSTGMILPKANCQKLVAIEER